VLQASAGMRASGVPVDGDAVARLWRDAWSASRGPKGANAELLEYASRHGVGHRQNSEQHMVVVKRVACGEVEGVGERELEARRGCQSRSLRLLERARPEDQFQLLAHRFEIDPERRERLCVDLRGRAAPTRPTCQSPLDRIRRDGQSCE